MNIGPSPSDTLLQARWLLPAGEQWLSPGCVLVREGRIVRVWEGADAEAVDRRVTAAAGTSATVSCPATAGLAADAEVTLK